MSSPPPPSLCSHITLLPLLLLFSSSLVSASLPPLPFFNPSDDPCFASNVDIRSRLSNATAKFQIHPATPDCIRKLHTQQQEIEPSVCPPDLISMELSPQMKGDRIVSHASNLPHVQLNISVMVHAPVSHIYVRLHCLYAPSQEDVYCHNEGKMTVPGLGWAWPCRGVAIEDEPEIGLPAVFGYSCFRLFGYSQYYVNVTVFPQNCRRTVLVTTPHDLQLLPEISHFYDEINGIIVNKNDTANYHWAPMLFLDFSEADGVWVRVAYSKEVRARTIVVEIYERNAKYWEKLEIKYPSTGIKWENAGEGNYSAYAYVRRHDCAFQCKASDTGCKACIHTALNFTLSQDYLSPFYQTIRYLDAVVKTEFWLVLVGVCVFVVLCALGCLGLCHLCRKPRVSDLQVDGVKTVHVMYADDCAEHNAVVREFVDILEAAKDKNDKSVIKCQIDQRDLILQGSNARPYQWVPKQVYECDYVLIVISACSQHILKGRKLKSNQPYPDMFRLGSEHIIPDLGNKDKRDRYVLIYLPYSPRIVPDAFKSYNLQIFYVPEEIGELVMYIHGVRDMTKKANVNMLPSVDRPFRDAVGYMNRFLEARKDEDWAETRFYPEGYVEPPPMDIKRLRVRQPHPTDHAGQVELSERMGLMPPPDDEELDAQEQQPIRRLSLQPMPDSDSDDDDEPQEDRADDVIQNHVAVDEVVEDVKDAPDT